MSAMGAMRADMKTADADAAPDIGIRYCGGCNPYYDAGKVVKAIETATGVNLLPAGDRVPDICLLLKQCSSDCFPEPEKMSRKKTIVITGEDCVDTAVLAIRNYLAEEKENQSHDEQRTVH